MKKSDYKTYSDLTLDELEQLVQELEIMSIKALKEKKKSLRITILKSVKLIIKDEKIVDFGYQGNSCIYCQASASLLSKISINAKKNKLNKLCDDAKLYFDGNYEIIENKWISLEKLFKKKNQGNFRKKN